MCIIAPVAIILMSSIFEFIGIAIAMCYYVTVHYPPSCGNLTNFHAVLDCSTTGAITIGMSLFLGVISIPAVGLPIWCIHSLFRTCFSHNKYLIKMIWSIEIITYLTITWFVMPFTHKIVYPDSECNLVNFYTGMNVDCFKEVILGVMLIDGFVIGFGLVGYITERCINHHQTIVMKTSDLDQTHSINSESAPLLGEV